MGPMLSSYVASSHKDDCDTGGNIGTVPLDNEFPDGVKQTKATQKQKDDKDTAEPS